MTAPPSLPLDLMLRWRMGLEVIATPLGSLKANALCERLIGTLRRECLDWMIPLTEEHLRNSGRGCRITTAADHTLFWGQDFPILRYFHVRLHRHRHRFDRSSRIVAHPVLNGLHHEYSLLVRAA
jgi:hypothetical protein